MLTISDYKRCTSQEGREFFALTLQGETTVAQSENGNFYLTANKTSMPTSFTAAVCQTLIGKTLSGSIQKVPCEPYEYTNQAGETVTLNYRYQYSPREESTAIKQVASPMEVPQQHYQHVPFMPMANQIVATA
jgi:hypothetical protein